MATTLALAMRASMSAGGVVSGANEAAGAMDKMAKHAKQTADGVSVLSNLNIAGTVMKGVSMLSDVMSSAANAVVGYAASVANALDHIQDLSERTGIAAESLQVLQMAARMSGVEDVTTAIQKLTIAIGKAAESGKTDVFDTLGLDFKKLQAMAPEDQFKAIQKAIAALPTEAQRAAAAVQIFGRSGIEMLPLLTQDLEAVEQRMRRLGAVVSDTQVAAIDEMNDSLAMVRATFDGIIGQVEGNLAPLVTAIAETFMEFVEGYKSAAGEGGTGIANAITNGLFDVIEALATVVDASINAFNKYSSVMEWAVKALDQIIRNIPGVGAAYAAVSLGLSAADMAAGDTTVARDTVRTVRGKYEAAQTPEAQEARRAAKEQRDKDRKAALDAQEATDQAAQQAEAARKDADKVREETRTAEEKHAAEMKRLDELKAANALDEETYQRAKAQADERLRTEQAKGQQEAQRAQEKAAREAEEAAKKDQRRAEKVAAVDEKMAGKQEQIDAIDAEKAAALKGKSNEALRANDIRSSEGMAQFLALATGRQDPAIEENRKTNAKLEEIRKELRALQQEKVDILGAAA